MSLPTQKTSIMAENTVAVPNISYFPMTCGFPLTGTADISKAVIPSARNVNVTIPVSKTQDRNECG